MCKPTGKQFNPKTSGGLDWPLPKGSGGTCQSEKASGQSLATAVAAVGCTDIYEWGGRDSRRQVSPCRKREMRMSLWHWTGIGNIRVNL